MNDLTDFTWEPVGPDNWQNLEELFGERGGREGCWCMRWRLPRERFESQKGEANKRAFKAGIDTGSITGIVGYVNGKGAAWCSIGPRSNFVGLKNSELLAPIDDEPVWSVTCLFVSKQFRRQQLSDLLLEAAVTYAGECGAKIVEGYPLAPLAERTPVAAAWTGFETVFLRTGFVETARRAPMRPIFRRYLD